MNRFTLLFQYYAFKNRKWWEQPIFWLLTAGMAIAMTTYKVVEWIQTKILRRQTK